MKTETKKALFFLFLVIAYSLQAIVSMYPFCYVYIIGFMAAVALVYVIKNKYIAAVVGMLTLLAMDFNDLHYKYLTVLAFLLICAHKSLISDTTAVLKKNKASYGFSFFCVQLTVLATVALFIYDFILIAGTKNNSCVLNYSRAVTIFLSLTGIFLYSLFNSHSSTKKKSSQRINKQVSGSLHFMYLISIFAFSATVLFSYAKIGFIHMSYNVIFFPWFVYICSMVYNGDPYIESLAENIENLFTKISYKDKVSE